MAQHVRTDLLLDTCLTSDALQGLACDIWTHRVCANGRLDEEGPQAPASRSAFQ